MNPIVFRSVAIVGVGMMGGSLGLELRARNLVENVIGIDHNEAALTRAQERGAITEGTTDLAAGVRDSDCIILATPVGSIPALLQRIAPDVGQDTLITDIGSTKMHIVEVGEQLFGTRFVGGHPMAGSEASGVEAAIPNLFAGAAWAIVRSTSFEIDDDTTATRIAALAAALGARPVFLDAAHHDRVCALISHLPHVLSFAYAQTVANSPDPSLAHSMAGGSFRDMMRVSQSDPTLWNEIFRANRTSLLETINTFETYLYQLKQTITRELSDKL